MPANAEERVANAVKLVELALAKAIPGELLYVDPLVLLGPEAKIRESVRNCVSRWRQILYRFIAIHYI